MTSRHWSGAAGAALVVLGLALWISWPGESGPARPTAGDQVIAFGDSLVRGVGASPGGDLVSELSRRLGMPIVNAGRSRQPRVVLVLLGGNDLLRRVPPDETIENLETIVARIRARGAAVVLATVEVGFFTRSNDEAYEALAARTRAALVPGIFDGILGRRELMADGIHPNDRGYALMADRLEPVLRDLVEAR
jgi:lysophospholipase L1-like esterase